MGAVEFEVPLLVAATIDCKAIPAPSLSRSELAPILPPSGKNAFCINGRLEGGCPSIESCASYAGVGVFSKAENRNLTFGQSIQNSIRCSMHGG